MDKAREATARREQHQAAESATAATAQADRTVRRMKVYQQTAATCPLPIEPNYVSLPGHLQLMDDEFLVRVAKEWGISTQRLALTTHRLVHSSGMMNKEQGAVYLTDIRDVRYRKQALHFGGELVIDTASGSLEGLPKASDGQALRDQLLAMVHWARQRGQQTGSTATTSSGPAAPPPADIPALIGQLAQLRDAGAITVEDFDRKKDELLARM